MIVFSKPRMTLQSTVDVASERICIDIYPNLASTLGGILAELVFMECAEQHTVLLFALLKMFCYEYYYYYCYFEKVQF